MSGEAPLKVRDPSEKRRRRRRRRRRREKAESLR
jgi:hypothetical protein